MQTEGIRLINMTVPEGKTCDNSWNDDDARDMERGQDVGTVQTTPCTMLVNEPHGLEV